METGIVISLAAVLISLIGLILNGRKDTRSDAAANAVTQPKLDNLIAGVTNTNLSFLIEDAMAKLSEVIGK